MSSSRGIFQVAKQQLDEVALGSRATVSCTAYGRGDGMESAQCNGGYQPSGWRARDGRLWFPTVKGLVVIDPTRSAPSNTVAPPVWIEAVRADGQAVPVGGTPRIPAGTKQARDRVHRAESGRARARSGSAIGYRGSTSSGWRPGRAGASRTPTSARRLPLRGHRLATTTGCGTSRARDGTSAWTPLFYQTAWFYGAMVLLAVGAGLGLHALRVRDLRLRNAVLAERARLSQEIHDHISQIMTGIVPAARRRVSDPGAGIRRGARLHRSREPAGAPGHRGDAH